MTEAGIQEMLKKHSHDADKPDAIQLAVIIMTYYIRFIFSNSYWPLVSCYFQGVVFISMVLLNIIGKHFNIFIKKILPTCQ